MAQSVMMVAETLSRLGINISYLIILCVYKSERKYSLYDRLQINVALRYLVNELTF